MYEYLSLIKATWILMSIRKSFPPNPIHFVQSRISGLTQEQLQDTAHTTFRESPIDSRDHVGNYV